MCIIAFETTKIEIEYDEFVRNLVVSKAKRLKMAVDQYGC